MILKWCTFHIAHVCHVVRISIFIYCLFLAFEVPPIEQKRMAAFINEFITSTVTFLNDFMTKCENKFVEFEQKMQRIESSLLIVEAKVFKCLSISSNVRKPHVINYAF